MLRGAIVVVCGLVASCANVECTINSECGSYARCDMNRCVRDCVQDRDCNAGEVCNLNGACVPGSVPSDDRPAPDDTPDAAVSIDAPADVTNDLGLDAPGDVALDIFVDNDPPRDSDPPIDLTVPDVTSMPDVMSMPDVTTPPDRGTLPDASVGPVGVGVYEYAGVRPAELVAPVAVAWHPGGTYALILSASDGVFRYDVSASTVTRVAAAGSGVSWRAASFVPDGSRALLLGNTVSGTTRRGRVFVWDHATAMLAERTSDQWTAGVYKSLRWNADGTRGALLGAAANYLSIWFVNPDGARVAAPIAYGRVVNTECDDVGWLRDGFGDPALAVVCGTNTGEILSVTNLSSATPMFSVAASAGSVGNTARMAVRPQGDLALAIGNSSGRLYRYRDFVWYTGFSTPSVTGAFGVAFASDGARALAFGGFGRVHEYRYDQYSAADIVDVSINLAAAPFTQPTDARVNDVAWRPGCDEGLAVGGRNSAAGTTAFVAYYRVTNGRRCP